LKTDDHNLDASVSVQRPQRMFTAEEANLTLPLVRSVVTDILAIGQDVKAAMKRLGDEFDSDPTIAAQRRELQELYSELDSIGCTYRDWNYTMGLVDFPAIIDGEEVLLCWRSDEPEVLHYHAVNAGYSARSPLPIEPVPDIVQG